LLQGVFGFYAGTNIIAFIMIFFWVPETKQRTLEELDYIFAVPTSVFMRYQLNKALPYWIQRWVFLRKDAVLEPLYHLEKFNRIADSNGEQGTVKLAEKPVMTEVVTTEGRSEKAEVNEPTTGA
jgi:hypothetical protein